MTDEPNVDANLKDLPPADLSKQDPQPNDPPPNDPPKQTDPPAVSKDPLKGPVKHSPKDPTKDPGAPIDYSSVKPPEGVDAKDPMYVEAVGLFEEARISPEAAQKLVAFVDRRDKAAAERHIDGWSKVVVGWQAQLKTDLNATTNTEFTGTGFESADNPRLKEVQVLADKAITAYGGADAPAIREHLKAYALADHPAFARFLARAGRTVREDKLPRPNEGGSRLADAATTLYPNQGKKE